MDVAKIRFIYYHRHQLFHQRIAVKLFSYIVLA